MMLNAQETDIKLINTVPTSLTYAMQSQHATAYSSLLDFAVYPLIEMPNLVKSISQTIVEAHNSEVKCEARRLVVVIEQALLAFCHYGISLSHLPPLSGYEDEDGSIVIEWMFEDFRIGFSIEVNPVESSWYLVANQNLNYVNASGLLHGVDLAGVIVPLINFVVANT